MMRKLQFWERCIKIIRLNVLATSQLPDKNQLKLVQNTKTNIITHLRGLSATFREYFPVLSDSHNWIRNSFDKPTIFSSQGLITEDTGTRFVISSDYELKLRFKSLSLIKFG
jgi:hypothetical protein